MKKAWIALALISGTASASGTVSLSMVEDLWNQNGRQEVGRWFPFGDQDLVDLRTISRQNGIITVWTKSRTREGVGPAKEMYPTSETYLMKVNIDCRRNRMGPSAMLIYDGDGKVLHSEDIEEYRIKYSPVAPSTLGEFQLDFACR